jgi:AcrR family transcriptional regulator
MEFQRARSEEQKEHRVSEIVGATARLYKKNRFEDISFAMIAKEARFTRSNLYKYFSSKEEIFLAFLKRDIVAWRKDFVKSCKKRKIRSVGNFASVWVETFSMHKRLLDLLSIMPLFLEKNVSEQTLVEFKRTASDEMKVLSDIACLTFPEMNPHKAGQFLELQLALAIGLYQITNLSEMQKKVLEYPEFRHMKIDFNSYLQKAVECLLHGLLY